MVRVARKSPELEIRQWKWDFENRIYKPLSVEDRSHSR